MSWLSWLSWWIAVFVFAAMELLGVDKMFHIIFVGLVLIAMGVECHLAGPDLLPPRVVVDMPEQICITRDNVQVGVDGFLHLRALNRKRAPYGLLDILPLARTAPRNEIGKIELNRIFEERNSINRNVTEELDQASHPLGVKVPRWEIKNVNPPKDVLSAMERQMRAEREKRAVVPPSNP